MKLDLSKIFKQVTIENLTWKDFLGLKPSDLSLDENDSRHGLNFCLEMTPSVEKDAEFQIRCHGDFAPVLTCDECLSQVEQVFKFDEKFKVSVDNKHAKGAKGRRAAQQSEDSILGDNDDFEFDLASLELETYVTSDTGEMDFTNPLRDILNEFVPLHFFCSKDCEENSQKVLSAGLTPSRSAEAFGSLKHLLPQDKT
jgi:hypothetical protein